MAPPNSDADAPDYTVYKSRRRLWPGRDGDGDGGSGSGPGRFSLGRLRNRKPRDGRRRPWVKWLLLGAGAWIAISILAFVFSSLLQQLQFDGDTRDVIDGTPNLITDTQTILVMGTDRRKEDSKEPGANEGPARADTLLLIRAGAGTWRKLSIPRDSLAEIPGRGSQKINAAYAFGGSALQVQTVEGFMGIDVDHVVEIDFAGFEDFIDALGGVKVTTKCVVSRINGGASNGGFTLRLRPGTNTLSGEEALALARTRKNSCNRKGNEDDRTRARRQQKILAGIRGRLSSPLRAPVNFVRGPLIGWTAPKAIVTDMGPLTLSQLFAAAVIGDDDNTRVLRPSGDGAGGSLVISEDERRTQAERLLRN
ncbi:MAG: LCP family protein [Solirubrobacterales bacterium]